MNGPVTFAAAYLFAIGGVCFLLGCGIWALVRRWERPAFRDVLAEVGGPLPGLAEDDLAARLARLEREVAALRKDMRELQRNLVTGDVCLDRPAADGVSGARRPAPDASVPAWPSDDRRLTTDDRHRRPRGEVQLMMNVRRLRAQS
ncbi:MAG: hypothetical protein AB1776_02315 [Bacillota bacterium]